MRTIGEQFNDLCSFLEREGQRFLLVGGLAVNHYGYSRATMDIDLMTVVPDSADFVARLRADGFNYYSVLPLVIFAQKSDWTSRVDFLRINSETFEKLMLNANEVEVFGRKVAVPSLNDLIAMKFHAFKQGGERRRKDFNDIAWLCVLNGLEAERDLHASALRYANEDIYKEVVLQIERLRSGT